MTSKFSRAELLVLVLVSTALMLFSSVPNWAGHNAQDRDWAFRGTYYDPQDYAVHVAMMQAGLQGAWSYQLRFTTESHGPAYIRLFYVTLGELDRLLQLPPEDLYEIARWVLGYTTILAIYMLARRWFGASPWAWLALTLCILGSGLGWLQRIFGLVPGPVTPIDFWFIDGYVLFSLSLFPHFAFSLALMCLALSWYVDYLDTRKPIWLGAVIAAGLIVQLVNPIAFVVVDVAMAACTLANWLKDRRSDATPWPALCLVAAAQLPILIYSLNVLTRAPVWMQFTAQDQTPSPSPAYYLWGYGLLWPLALLGAIDTVRGRSPVRLGALAWVAAGFTLAYVPVAIQRRFLLGISIPLSLLATSGLMLLTNWTARRFPWISRRVFAIASLVALLASVTTLVFIPAQAIYMQSRTPLVFYPRNLDGALEWIRQNTRPEDVVLATPETAQLVAQKAGRKVFAGHEMETINFLSKEAQVTAFYKANGSPGWLQRYPVSWVVYGPYEQDIAPAFHPGANLQVVYQSDQVVIYRNLLYSSPEQ